MNYLIRLLSGSEVTLSATSTPTADDALKSGGKLLKVTDDKGNVLIDATTAQGQAVTGQQTQGQTQTPPPPQTMSPPAAPNTLPSVGQPQNLVTYQLVNGQWTQVQNPAPGQPTRYNQLINNVWVEVAQGPNGTYAPLNADGTRQAHAQHNGQFTGGACYPVPHAQFVNPNALPYGTPFCQVAGGQHANMDTVIATNPAVASSLGIKGVLLTIGGVKLAEKAVPALVAAIFGNGDSGNGQPLG